MTTTAWNSLPWSEKRSQWSSGVFLSPLKNSCHARDAEKCRKKLSEWKIVRQERFTLKRGNASFLQAKVKGNEEAQKRKITWRHRETLRWTMVPFVRSNSTPCSMLNPRSDFQLTDRTSSPLLKRPLLWRVKGAWERKEDTSLWVRNEMTMGISKNTRDNTTQERKREDNTR